MQTGTEASAKKKQRKCGAPAKYVKSLQPRVVGRAQAAGCWSGTFALRVERTPPPRLTRPCEVPNLAYFAAGLWRHIEISGNPAPPLNFHCHFAGQ